MTLDNSQTKGAWVPGLLTSGLVLNREKYISLLFKPHVGAGGGFLCGWNDSFLRQDLTQNGQPIFDE